jgi:N-acetylmuramoyl-L-alanine amidase
VELGDVPPPTVVAKDGGRAMATAPAPAPTPTPAPTPAPAPAPTAMGTVGDIGADPMLLKCHVPSPTETAAAVITVRGAAED